jgi:hypothetical protein
MNRLVCLSLLCLFAVSTGAVEPTDIKTLLDREIVGPRQARLDVTEYLRGRIPKLLPAKSADEWAKESERLRRDVLAHAVFKGEASKWREQKVVIKWLETIEGGPGYRIKKLRYEALPGLWIPALLYEPEKLSGKVPLMLAVNGHDRTGKAAGYKQERCINLAKRGVIVLNVEWLGMGQLRGDGYGHGRMNQLDLCGTPGLSVFYLSMSRGLDVLLSQEHADSSRVGVSGLSGGGWQTIFISSLDTRVTLTNPVAGYSSFFTRIDHHKDLGDSEQTPCDLASVADYTHLTAMMAPRPTLLTFNSKDNCCFEAGYALPPLLKAASPMFKVFDRESALRSHVNDDPGDHNFGKDNREALYRMIRDHWFAGNKDFDAKEIDVTKEIKTADQLGVELPAGNADFNTLARALMKELPRSGFPSGERAAYAWRDQGRERLAKVLRYREPGKVFPVKEAEDTKAGIKATYWKIRLGESEEKITWTVPVVELVPEKADRIAVLFGDGGRKALSTHAARLLSAGRRVLIVDPFYNGESSIDQKAFLFALMVATVGDRPLGLQATQLVAVNIWITSRIKDVPVELVAVGPRSSVTALATAGLSQHNFSTVTVHDPMGSLKEIVERNVSFEQMPELFCFGLLEQFDVKHLAVLSAPRSVRIAQASERAKKELADLKKWYAILGHVYDPFAEK